MEAVAFHSQLASQWEQKYRRSSFAYRQGMVGKCLAGISLEATTWLDAGCGTGTLARWLAEQGCKVEGVDASTEMLDVARKLTSQASKVLPVTFRQIETIEALPFPAKSFDGVLCSSVLEYVINPRACMGELGRVLRPNGLLVISVPSARSIARMLLKRAYACTAVIGRPWPRYLSISRHEYSVGEFRRLLQTVGLRMQSFVSLGTPAARWFPQNERAGSLLMFCARKEEVQSK
ncbi:MAG TPA: methyltransferase domain-containing protein [Terriglobales bacterium]|nr:methyltransferase domain-containing protein [Terriglobales bacterium]